MEHDGGEAQRYDAEVDVNLLPLPTSQLGAIGLEVRRTFRAPYENLFVAGCNGGLVLLAWFTLPASVTGLMWNPHGPDSLAIALLVWMVADVPATNVFGSDAARMTRGLSHPRKLHFMLRAKALALWALAAFFCIPIDVASGLHSGRSLTQAVAVALAIAFIPLAVLGLAAYVGALYPYHPISLRARFNQDRRAPKRLLRWVILVTLPYVLVPALGQLAVIGFVALEHLCSVNIRHLSSKSAFVTLLAATAALTIAINAAGYRGLLRLVARNKTPLSAMLADETL